MMQGGQETRTGIGDVGSASFLMGDVLVLVEFDGRGRGWCDVGGCGLWTVDCGGLGADLAGNAGRTMTMAGDEEDCHNQSKGRKRISQRINQQEMKRVVVLLLQRRVV